MNVADGDTHEFGEVIRRQGSLFFELSETFEVKAEADDLDAGFAARLREPF